jgi:hypothetical protein
MQTIENGVAAVAAICFSFERPPAFLDNEAGVVERGFGFLLIVEKGDLVGLLKSGFAPLSRVA